MDNNTPTFFNENIISFKIKNTRILLFLVEHSAVKTKIISHLLLYCLILQCSIFSNKNKIPATLLSTIKLRKYL